MFCLKNHQKDALYLPLENGVHSHSTGTGKSLIALSIIQNNPDKNILFIFEHFHILSQIFHPSYLKKHHISLSNFLIYNFTYFKPSDWTSQVNSSIFWKKPILIIINRPFLTSFKRYLNLRINIDLILHDECHTISNKSSQEFYQFIHSHFPKTICIGFSATPRLDIPPFNKLLSKFSIFDAVSNNIILPPKVIWFKSSHIISQLDILLNIKEIIKPQPYKKILVWSGLIDKSIEYANLWKTIFTDFTICIDNSRDNSSFPSYDLFKSTTHNAILFCAGKHREGSDIPNLDTCVFLDKVQDRNTKTFIQSLGRVLRKDTLNLKTHGLIIDTNIRSSISICDKLNTYLHSPGIFPWVYHYYPNRNITINSLTMHLNPSEPSSDFLSNTYQPTIEDLINRFVRPIPDNFEYSERLHLEIKLIHSKNLIKYLLNACDVLDLTSRMPHITRGSCGSSLVCYLLGISHIDPIKYKIRFQRFLNEYRDNLPDIDFDFCHHLRDEVFLKLQMKWNGKVARISNHVFYHHKSSLREAMRRIGIRKMIPSIELSKIINKLSSDKKIKLKSETQKLNGTFRTYSLHCGGIVLFPNGIPSKLKLINKKNSIISQIILNKHDVAKEKMFKIDILSSRGLSQLYEANNYHNINFEDEINDDLVWKLFENGDNIGLTFGESPLIRKAFMRIKPRNLFDLAVCLAIIRPAVNKSFKHIIFDDDAIDLIHTLLNCSLDEADKYRRAFSKGDIKIINEVYSKIKKLDNKKEIIDCLKNLRKYSFCKAHALSYAQLLIQLAYMKVYHPKEFWKATLNNNQSMYRKWVHLYQAKLHDVDLSNLKKSDISIYAINRQKKMSDLSISEQLRKFGFWIMKDKSFFPGCFYSVFDDYVQFNGIIASSRCLDFQKGKEKKMVLLIGVQPNLFIEVLVYGISYYTNKIGIIGKGKITDTTCNVIECRDYKYY